MLKDAGIICNWRPSTAAFFKKGMKKVNFSGGEPFIHKKGTYVGELVKYCKEDLKLKSVTIVSNGSLIKEEWFQEYGIFISSHFCIFIFKRWLLRYISNFM